MHGQDFTLLLVIGDADISADEQWALSEQVVLQGCRYAYCIGHDCSSWDDSIDIVCVMREIDGLPVDLVMTMWDNAAANNQTCMSASFVKDASHSEWTACNFLVLYVGTLPSGLQNIHGAVLKEFLEHFANV
ncbi:MAG: hypothetical protein H6815_13915 [Phycisphaeraceae bacterium]|nr:hypothetical protein [Phycisphaerales bacterium]MCB9861535.1 hypothetical protein [Phycisphaeraceae bacterium]